jgi:hypothetical protein
MQCLTFNKRKNDTGGNSCTPSSDKPAGRNTPGQQVKYPTFAESTHRFRLAGTKARQSSKKTITEQCMTTAAPPSSGPASTSNPKQECPSKFAQSSWENRPIAPSTSSNQLQWEPQYPEDPALEWLTEGDLDANFRNPNHDINEYGQYEEVTMSEYGDEYSNDRLPISQRRHRNP